MSAVATGEAGLVMSMNWMPPPTKLTSDTVAANVPLAVCHVATPSGTYSHGCVSVSRAMDETGDGEAGSVTSMIWRALSALAATTAYVLVELATVATCRALFKLSNPPWPSERPATGTGKNGSVMLITCTALPSPEADYGKRVGASGERLDVKGAIQLVKRASLQCLQPP